MKASTARHPLLGQTQIRGGLGILRPAAGTQSSGCLADPVEPLGHAGDRLGDNPCISGRAVARYLKAQHNLILDVIRASI